MRTRPALLLMPLLVALACRTPNQSAPGGSADESLNKALRSYVVEFLRRNPTTNTDLGGAGLDPSLRDVDGMLRDYSATALAQEDHWLMELGPRLRARRTRDLWRPVD